MNGAATLAHAARLLAWWGRVGAAQDFDTHLIRKDSRKVAAALITIADASRRAAR